MSYDWERLNEWLIEVRREFHMHPEISNLEVRTTARVVEMLTSFGIEVRTFDDMTGAVGLLRGEQPGKTIALRADIDALPLRELNEVPYKSKTDEAMHACGHDANTAIMLGVAKMLTESGAGRSLKGNVKFLFQPAEERVSGAAEMIARGVLNDPDVDCVIAGHMDPTLSAGRIGIYETQGYASADHFFINVTGKGTHGGRPNEGIDPIVAAAHFVTAIQSVVGRNIKPTDAAVISIGKFVSGTVGNIIPEKAELEGTVRALTQEVREYLLKRIHEICEGIESTFQVKCDVRVDHSVPPCTNDREVSAFLHETAVGVLDDDHVSYLEPMMGAEDFALFTLERPGAIIRLGCGFQEKGKSFPLHSPHFDIDESVLLIGVRMFSEAVMRYLKG